MMHGPLNVKLRLYLRTDEQLFLSHPYSLKMRELQTLCKLWT